jgi:hypothetical protein
MNMRVGLNIQQKGKIVIGYSLLDGNLKIDRCALGASRQSVT